MKISRGILAVLMGLGSAPGPAHVASDTNLSAQSAACQPGTPIDQMGFVEIGDIRQWVTIKGQDCVNPVVLIVHGGPGNPNTPYADKVFGPWTKDFTVVQWDQRGSGKTFEASPPAEGERLTVERLTQDGVDVARYATRRLGKKKVILMGGSWGSALAVHMAKAKSDFFSAYVGTAQLVSFNADLQASFAKTLRFAGQAGDKESITKLETIGGPPWTNPRAFGALRRVTRKYEALKATPAPSSWFDAPAAGYDTPAYEAAYRAGEDYSYLEFVGLNGDGMGARIDLAKLGTRFEMPVIMLQGDDDLVTPSEISLAYFESLKAPRKAFIRLLQTGHDPNQTMVDAQLEALKGVRSEAIAAD